MSSLYMDISNLSSASSFPLRFRRLSSKPALQKSLLSPKGISKTDNSSGSANRMFIFGLGFVGQLFAKQLKKDNWHVAGTCRSVIKKQKLEEMGFDVQLYMNDSESDNYQCNQILRSLTSLEQATHLLVSVPPIVGLGDPVLNQHQDLVQSRLVNGNLQWLCYLSSTSVYGNCYGAWVDEDHPAIPSKESARARLAAEERWLNVGNDLGVSVQILRLGGIYGPGRRRIYNVVDDDPAPRAEVFAFAQALIEQKWPGKIQPTPAANMSGSADQETSRGGEKRVLNARLKNELGVRLLHPTYRSGLESIIKSMESPFQ